MDLSLLPGQVYKGGRDRMAILGFVAALQRIWGRVWFLRFTPGAKVGREAWDRRRSMDFAVGVVSVAFRSPLVQRAWHAKAVLSYCTFGVSFCEPQHSIVERTYRDRDGVFPGLSCSYSFSSELWSATLFQHSGSWQEKSPG